MSEVKRGMLKFYHRGLLNKKWKAYKFILFESSLLTWYADVKHKKPDGMVLLKDVERYIRVGPYTTCLPDFPHLDNEYDQIALIAFPQSVNDCDRDIIWLLCEDVDELNSWMKSIIQTLPSHTLRMERLVNTSSSSVDENIPTTSELNSPEINSPDPLILKTNSVALPLAAGLIGTRLQGHTMNSKENPLRKVGYDYGDTLLGTGEDWGYCLPLEVLGFDGLGGNGCHSNHIDIIRHEEDEDRIGERANDEAVEEVTCELSKNDIDDKEEEEEDFTNYREDERDEKDDENDPDLEQIEEDLQMIDSDNEK